MIQLSQGLDAGQIVNQFGLAGLVMVGLGVAVGALFKQQNKSKDDVKTTLEKQIVDLITSHDKQIAEVKQAYDKTIDELRAQRNDYRERADRADSEVKRLNEVMYEKLVPSLTEAANKFIDAASPPRRKAG